MPDGLFTECSKKLVAARRARAIKMCPADFRDTAEAYGSPVHAAEVAQIATLMLDGVDLGNRRRAIAGRVRPLDDLTRQLLLN